MSIDMKLGLFLGACVVFAVWRSYINVKKDIAGRRFEDTLRKEGAIHVAELKDYSSKTGLNWFPKPGETWLVRPEKDTDILPFNQGHLTRVKILSRYTSTVELSLQGLPGSAWYKISDIEWIENVTSTETGIAQHDLSQGIT